MTADLAHRRSAQNSAEQTSPASAEQSDDGSRTLSRTLSIHFGLDALGPPELVRMPAKPNILFINTDQQTWNHVSAYGNRHVRTPNIDRLAANGISFMRSYCADPVCAPARASWMTGLYTSENGVAFNGGLMHEDIPDLGQILRGHGYDAVHCGKWHVDGRAMRDSFHNLYTGKRDIGACGGEYYDRVSTHAAIDFLDRHNPTKPYYLQVALVNPHDICEYQHNHEHKNIPGPLEQGLLSAENLPPLPGNFRYDEHETIVQQVFRRGHRALIHAPINNGIRDWSEDQWRFLSWNHYRFIEAADQQIGLILNALEKSRFRDNTLIIFSIDHGEASGCHQTFQKFALYEESIRVPFVIATLGDCLEVPKNVSDYEHLVSGVDLVTTVLDYAGVEIPDGVKGLSLKSLVRLRDVPWREFAYVESNYWARAIVTRQFKYVTEYRPKLEEDFVPPGPDPDSLGLEQLFDLEGDPLETKNLAGDPRYADKIAACRGHLFDFEATLHRRPLREGQPRDTVRRWSERLREAWAGRDE